jgi:hypothetical protein
MSSLTEANVVPFLMLAAGVGSWKMSFPATQKLDPSAVVTSPSVSFLLLRKSWKLTPAKVALLGIALLPLLVLILPLSLRLWRAGWRILMVLAMPPPSSKAAMGFARSGGVLSWAPSTPSSAPTSLALSS